MTPAFLARQRQFTAELVTPWGLVAAAFLGCALADIAARPLMINHDAAACLDVGRRLLNHARLYVDVVDTNPPLVYELHAIPVAIASAIGADVIPTFLLLVWILTAHAAIATRRWLTGVHGTSAAHADAAAAAIAAFSLTLRIRNDFGQREHLFFLALLPYLAVRTRRASGLPVWRWPAIATGTVAGLFACLKPHFVGILLAVEAYWFLSRRRRDFFFATETLAAASVGLAYAAHLALLPSDIRGAWLGRWLPFVARGYAAYDNDWRALIFGGLWLPALVCGLVFMTAHIGDARLRAFSRPLGVAAVASVVVFFAQHKGWSYHAIPAQGLTWVLVAWAATAIDVRVPRRALELTALTAIAAELVLVAAVVVGAAQVSSARDQIGRVGLGKDIVTFTHDQDPVLVLSTNVATAYPLLVQLDRRGGSRYVFEFPLPVFYSRAHVSADGSFPYVPADAGLAAAEARFRSELAEDIRARRPPLVIVAPSNECQACPEGFSLRDYLARTGFLRDAMGAYREVQGTTPASLFVLSSGHVTR